MGQTLDPSESFHSVDFTPTAKVFYKLVTKDEVIHAEANAIAKLAKSTESGKDAIMFLTHAPCIHCAKQIYTAGIKKVYFKTTYRNMDGINFLKKCNIDVEQYIRNNSTE